MPIPTSVPADFDLIASQGHGDVRKNYLDMTMHQIISKKASQTPNAIAIEMNGSTMTYKELDEKSNQLAHTLREKGAKSNSAIGVVGDRSPGLLVSILGILKSGAAYLPINPNFPADRQELILEDANATMVLTQPGKLTAKPSSALIMDITDPTLYEQSIEPVTDTSKPNDLAYIIYTSGSTGKPKGVAIEHHSIVNQLACGGT